MQIKSFMMGTAVGFLISATSFILAVAVLNRPAAISASPVENKPSIAITLPAPPPPVVATKEFTEKKYVAACAGDVTKFCPGLAFGRGAGGCLLAAKEKLSDICKAELPEIEADRLKSTKDRPYLEICKADLAKFCAGMSFGSGAGKCLLDSSSKISAGCREQLSQIEKDRLENP